MNPKSVFKKECKGFTQVSNALVVKSKLSASAIGIMTKLLSYHDFAIHKETEQRSSKLGEKTFNKAWKELVDAGFIKSESINNGKWSWRYTIINDPSLTDEERDQIRSEAVNQRRNTTPVKSGTGNQVRKTTADKGVGNTYTTNPDTINLNRSNTNEITKDPSSQVTVDGVTNEQVQDNIISVEESSIISGSTVKPSGEIIQSNNNQDWVEIFKQKVRLYVVRNNIKPSYVEETIKEFYNFKSYFPNDDYNCGIDKLFDLLLNYTGMHKMHNTNNNNSIQVRLIEKIQIYIAENYIDKSKVEIRINSYLTSEDFYSEDQNSDIDKAFNRVKVQTGLNKFINTLPNYSKPIPVNDNSIDNLGEQFFGRVDI